MTASRLLVVASLLLTTSLLCGCDSKQAENERLKQDNERLTRERDEARAELETLRAATPSTTGTSATAPATAATFSDIADSAARDEILDLAQLGVFEGMTGTFEAPRPITRAEFVRWLVRANNGIRKDKDIRLADGGDATFTDVPADHPDFRYIQGMANAGIAVGYDETTFKPDRELSREEMISIKCGLDQGGLSAKKATYNDIDLVWKWTDHQKVSRRYLDALYSEHFNSAKNIDRAFGAIKMFKPQQPVTRGEAAICIWRIGDAHGKTATEALRGSTPDR